MKIMIEVSGGVVTSITSTKDCQIYLIDRDNIKEKGDSIDDCTEAMYPDCVTRELGDNNETPEFDKLLAEALSEYTLECCGICGGEHPKGFNGDCWDDVLFQAAKKMHESQGLDKEANDKSNLNSLWSNSMKF